MKPITLTSLLTVVSCVTVTATTVKHHELQHANHIFNAVHSAMRQWGSSVLHNGMTAFVATVPADTQFYHGTSTPYRINDTEWLAFEPEHALLFARARFAAPPGGGPGGKRPPPGNGGAPPYPPPSELMPHDNTEGRGIRNWLSSGRSNEQQHCVAGKPCQSRTHIAQAADQQILLPSTREEEEIPSPPETSGHGYLHTYRTKHPLRLLYVDGQSAAKSSKGTLDLQDLAILNGQLSNDDDEDDKKHHNGPMNEYRRAAALCARARDQWDGKIDGILRMEGGFEIILCSFEQHLDVVSINQVKNAQSELLTADPNIEALPRAWKDIEYYKAIASRYDGIGGGRVTVDFTNLVSLFSHPDAIFFDETQHPRAKNGTKALARARQAIDLLAAGIQEKDAPEVNWQGVADMIVDRYSYRLAFMAKLDTLTDIHDEIDLTIRPFVNHANRNIHNEIQRCSEQFMPQQAFKRKLFSGEDDDAQIPAENTLPLAGAAINNVTSTICETVIAMRHMNRLDDVTAALQELRSWLGWPSWKRCSGCDVDEVCFVPIWPMGSLSDYETPRCKSAADWMDEPNNYWRD